MSEYYYLHLLIRTGSGPLELERLSAGPPDMLQYFTNLRTLNPNVNAPSASFETEH